jgi:hypothetical protein
MSANHYETNNNTIPYRKKLSKKEHSLHNVSAEFNKLTNIIYTNTNYTNSNPNQIKIINLSNNNNRNNPGKNLIFKNIKFIGVKKHSNYNKKRNNSNKNINNIPCVSSTEINTNLKKTYSNLNLNNIRSNNFLTKLNSNMNLYRKNNNSNNNTKINKSLPKSKSNSIFLTPFQKYNIHSRNRNVNNTLIKSNSNSGDTRSCNNSHNKKILNQKVNKCHTNYSTLLINTVSKSSQKIKQINKTKPKGSSEENKIMVKKLMKELENKDNEIKLKDKIIKEKENQIILLKQNEIQMKEKIKKITNKYEDINELYQNMMNQNKLLKEKIIENEKNINFLKEKELKLMRILYLIKEKGIDINSVLNEVKKESYAINNCDENNESNLTNSSNLTIYFPDKINMRNIMETKGAQKIPRIDINQIPEYSFQSEEDKQNDDEMPNQYNFMQNNIGFNNYGLHGFQNSV